MKIIVKDQREAIEIAGKLVEICCAIRLSDIDDLLQASFESYLCWLRDSIEVQGQSGGAA